VEFAQSKAQAQTAMQKQPHRAAGLTAAQEKFAVSIIAFNHVLTATFIYDLYLFSLMKKRLTCLNSHKKAQEGSGLLSLTIIVVITIIITIAFIAVKMLGIFK
jgi:hypothetical protein